MPDSVYQTLESSLKGNRGLQNTKPRSYTYFHLHQDTSPSSSGRPQIPFRLMLVHPKEPETLSDVVHRVGNHLVTESSKMTSAVVGGTVVEPTLVDFQGGKALIFMFGVSCTLVDCTWSAFDYFASNLVQDIAVQREGIFILRYRAFDIYSGVTGGDDQSPISAELYGGPFKVYSTRDFPGLHPSTDLTKVM